MAWLFDSGIFSVEGLPGDILVGARLEWYQAGTSTPQATYTDDDLATPNTNPVIADADGRFPPMWMAELSYKLILKDASGNTLRTRDKIRNPASGTFAPLAQLTASSGSSLVGFIQSGTGAVAQTIQQKARQTVSIADFGAAGNNVAVDATAILNAAVAVRGASASPDRTPGGEVHFPPGRYRIEDVLELGGGDGIYGMTFVGAVDGSTEIVFGTSAATIKVSNSIDICWRNIRFISEDGVDADQAAFTIEYTSGNPLVSWRFEGCSFVQFYKCFDVEGSSMCDGFHFDKCKFLQCYWLMDNNNDQAVNWNFVDCDWVNNELDTVKNKSFATPFLLRKGTFSKWTGGSVISYGPGAYFNLLAGTVCQSNSHKIVFDGVRIERVDDGGTCTPFFSRPEDGTYFVGGNTPSAALINSTILTRGSIPATVTHFRVWDNVKFVVDNCELETGKVVGVYGPLTATNLGEFVLTDSTMLPYEEDVTGRVNDHIAHSITMKPDTRGASGAINFQQRSCSLSEPFTLATQRLAVSGPTGSLPLGGTTVNLPTLPDHTRLRKLFIDAYENLTQDLTVELRNQADTTGYGSLTVNTGSNNGEAYIGAEIGFQIPTGTALMLKFTGTPAVAKGIVGIETL